MKLPFRAGLRRSSFEIDIDERSPAGEDREICHPPGPLRHSAAALQRRGHHRGGPVRRAFRPGGGGLHQRPHPADHQLVHRPVHRRQRAGGPVLRRRPAQRPVGDGAHRHPHQPNQRRVPHLRGHRPGPAPAGDDGHPRGRHRPGGAVHEHLLRRHARGDAV